MKKEVPFKEMDDLAVDGVYLVPGDFDVDVRAAIKYCEEHNLEPVPQFVVDMFDRKKQAK